MSEPKRHHTISRFYLEGFADKNGLLWVFDREKNEYRQQTPSNTAVQTNYYTFTGINGKRHRKEIEQILSDTEAEAKPVLVKLDNRKSIGPREKASIAAFVSFLMTRVPTFRKQWSQSAGKLAKQLFQSICYSEEAIIDLAERTGRKIKVDPRKLLEEIQRGEYDIEFPKEYSLEGMLDIGQACISHFLQMDWLFLWAPKNTSFITSDNPFLLLPPRDCDPSSIIGIGITTPGARKIIPLTSQTCLIMQDRGVRITTLIADQITIKAINLASAYNSDRFVIAHGKLPLERSIRIIEGKAAGC